MLYEVVGTKESFVIEAVNEKHAAYVASELLPDALIYKHSKPVDAAYYVAGIVGGATVFQVQPKHYVVYEYDESIFIYASSLAEAEDVFYQEFGHAPAQDNWKKLHISTIYYAIHSPNSSHCNEITFEDIVNMKDINEPYLFQSVEKELNDVHY